jgi:hypothetical protein
LGLGVIAQGSKQVLLGDEVIDYAPGQSMLTTIDSPVVAHVTRANQREPFLGLFLTLDSRLITQLASEMELPRRQRERTYRSISVETLDAPLVDALVRLVELLEEPALVPSLASLIQQEIIIRLLAGPHGEHLRDLVAAGSPSQQIAKAVTWLKRNFKEPVQVDELAARAHMSPSTFRQHFRVITGTSPLQFQKQLRFRKPAIDAQPERRREQRQWVGGLREPFPVQPRIQPPIWRATPTGCKAHATALTRRVVPFRDCSDRCAAESRSRLHEREKVVVESVLVRVRDAMRSAG